MSGVGATLTVENLRGMAARTLRIPSGEITAVLGDNGTGKSTLAVALAACLSRDTDPLGLGPQRRRLYVREGEDEGRATLRLDDGSSVEWAVPEGAITETGSPPAVPSLACRVGRPILEGTRQEVADRLLRALQIRPITEPELIERLAGALRAQTDAEESARRIARQVFAGDGGGWDAGAAVAKENALTARRRWEQSVAGAGEKQDYGSRKAETWRPATGWRAELEGMVVETAHRKSAEAQGEVERAHERIVELDRQGREAAALRRKATERRERIEAAEAELAAIPKAEGPDLDEASRRMQAAERAAEEAEAADAEARAADGKADGGEAANLRDLADAHYAEMKACDERFYKAKRAIANLELAKIALSQAQADSSPDECEACGQPIPEDHRWRTDRAANLAEAETALADAERAVSAAGALADHRKAAQAAELASEEAATKLRELERPSVAAPSEATLKAREALTEAKRAVVRAADAVKADRDRAVLRERIDTLRAEAEATPLTEAAPPTEEEREREKVRLDDAREAELRARRDAELVRLVADATAAHVECEAWEAVAATLAPSGMRKERADEAAAPVRKWADWMAAECGTEPIELEVAASRVALRFGGRPVEAASGSEQWLASTILRIAVAITCKAPVAILDGADVLSPPRRERLRAALDVVAAKAGIGILWTETDATPAT